MPLEEDQAYSSEGQELQESEYVIESSVEKTKWPSDAVNMLLNLRFEREQEFEFTTQGKKIDIWKEISDEMKKVGYDFPGHLCFAKYRNLTATYRRRKQMQEREKGSYCRWEHFELMDAHLSLNHVKKSKNPEIIEATYVEETELDEDGDSYYIIQQVEDEEMNVDQDDIVPQVVEMIVQEDSSKNDQFHWGPDSVKLLLELRLSKNYLWLNPNAKKIELWENVSKNMKKNHFNVEGHACDMKYRNLLKTYKANKDKFEKGILSYHHWPYYEMFDSHLNHEPPASDTHDGEANEEQVGDGKRVSVYQWSPAATRLMLNLRYEKESDFANHLKRKIVLWNEISGELRRHGYHVPGHACDSKYRNLLATYRKVKEKAKEKGSTFVRWEYFDIMDSHLRHNTYPSVKHYPFIPDESREYDEEELLEEEEKASSIRGRFKKRPRLSISQYLQAKLRADEKRRKEYQVLEEKRLKLEYKRLELEQKKIDVLKSLVIALKDSKNQAGARTEED